MGTPLDKGGEPLAAPTGHNKKGSSDTLICAKRKNTMVKKDILNLLSNISGFDFD